MSRNASGTYSLVSGNPVVTGTVIASAWANTTMADISTELTDSLSRSGKGGMLAPLKVANGAVGAPTMSFTNFPASGLYMAGAGDVRMAITGVDRMRWLASGSAPQIWNVAGAAWSDIGSTLTITDEATDTTCFPMFAISATGAVEAKSNASFTFNSDTETLGVSKLNIGSVVSGIYAGRVNANGDTVSGNSGFTVSYNISPPYYQVTHNLSNANYTIVACKEGATGNEYVVYVFQTNNNTFRVAMTNLIGGDVKDEWNFILIQD